VNACSARIQAGAGTRRDPVRGHHIERRRTGGFWLLPAINSPGPSLVRPITAGEAAVDLDQKTRPEIIYLVVHVREHPRS
jgi:hypothetical protein